MLSLKHDYGSFSHLPFLIGGFAAFTECCILLSMLSPRQTAEENKGAEIEMKNTKGDQSDLDSKEVDISATEEIFV